MNYKKLNYSWLVLVLVFASSSLGHERLNSKSGVSGDLFHSFPADSVSCRAGDYVISTTRANVWKVYLVEDLFFMSRLVTTIDSKPLLFAEEIELADSATPAKWHEIQLLVSEFKREFRTREDATEAVESNTLGDYIHGLCRGVKEFPKETSFVYTKS
jgi:hypothetical protein